MHELSLAENVIRIAETAARNASAAKVTRVRLAVGAFAHVEPDTLQFCCELAARQTLLEGAEFLVERTPGQAFCTDCEQDVALERIGFPCPLCGGFDLRVTAGDEMQVLDIAVI